MKIPRLLPAASAAAFLMVVASCSDYVGKEATHPLFTKAMNEKSSRAYREAAASLEEFLTICPKSPKAHYDVAELYKESLANYPAAIYHFQQYLAIRGETLSETDKLSIEGYIQQCEQQMFQQFRRKNGLLLASEVSVPVAAASAADTAKLAAKTAENTALRTKLQKYIENEKVILEQNQELRSRLARLASSSTPPTTAASPSRTGSSSTGTPTTGTAEPASAATPGTPGTTITGEDGTQYYFVAAGDGLLKISQKVYGTGNYWPLIQEANLLQENAVLKIGQKLVIPPLPESASSGTR